MCLLAEQMVPVALHVALAVMCLELLLTIPPPRYFVMELLFMPQIPADWHWHS